MLKPWLTRAPTRRLCMLVHGPYPVGEPRVEQEARVALEAGFIVDVISTRRPGEPSFEELEGIAVRRLGVEHKRGLGLREALLEYGGFLIRAAGVLARRPRRYDIVQVHSPPDFLIVCALVPWLFGAKVVLDIHDRSADLFEARFRGPGAGRLLARMERLATSVSDAVVTVHEPYRRALSANGVRIDKVSVVMNVVDPRQLPPRRAPEGVFRILYHGTITPSYGVSLIIAAGARLRKELDVPLEVELVGEGDSLPDLLEQAARVGLRHCLIASGQTVPRREALKRAAEASVGVIPNLPTTLNHFALPTKLFEYVSLGVPVAAASLPAIREHFTADDLMFFSPGSVESLLQALRAIAVDPEAARRRAESARRHMDAYSWSRNAERYISLLNTLSSRSAARSEP